MSETLTFACPACGTTLTVPAAMAGVTGPCPQCSTQITAPLPRPPVGFSSLPELQVQPPQYAPGEPPHPVSHAPAPIPAQAAYSAPPEPEAPVPAPGDSKAAYRPEPRQLPTRGEGMEPVGKPMSEYHAEPTRSQARTTHHGKRRFTRALIPLLFLLALGALVFGMWSFLNRGDAPSPPKLPAPEAPPETTPTPPPTGMLPPPRAVEPDETAPVAPPDALPEPTHVPQPDRPNVRPIETGASSTGGADSSNPYQEATKTLEAFLAAPTLEERLPLIETRTPREELAASCLAKPLPERVMIEPTMAQTDDMEKLTDCYYRVIFKSEEQRPRGYIMLVRKRGDRPYQVVVDPFLDLFGGRFAAFASKPTPDPKTFQLIVNAGQFCFADIPDPDKKITLRILSDDLGKELFSIYCSKISKIGEMLEDSQSGFGWGRPQSCTITVTWNTTDKNHPYLEASALRSLAWNP